MLRTLSVFVLAAATAATASAQSVYTAILNAGQETPAVVSPHTGFGKFYYDDAANTLSYDITISGLVGTFTVAHIHGSGAPGASAGVFFPLSGGPTQFSGVAGPFSAAQENALKAGLTYVNIHSSFAPGGEVRGQITTGFTQFACVLNGNKEIPPVPTAGTGTGTLVIQPDKSVVYSVTFSGLSGPATVAHLHDGAAGASGPPLFLLTATGPNTFAGTSAPQSDVTLAKIRAGRTYFNVHTAAFGAGEIRGQVVPSFTPYENGCNLGGIGTLAGVGVPAPGEAISLQISSGVPSQPGILFVGFTGKKLPFGFDCDLLVAPPVFPISLALGPSGAISLPATLPPSSPVNVDVHLQYFGAAPAENGGFFTTNGLVMHVTN